MYHLQRKKHRKAEILQTAYTGTYKHMWVTIS